MPHSLPPAPSVSPDRTAAVASVGTAATLAGLLAASCSLAAKPPVAGVSLAGMPLAGVPPEASGPPVAEGLENKPPSAGAAEVWPRTKQAASQAGHQGCSLQQLIISDHARAGHCWDAQADMHPAPVHPTWCALIDGALAEGKCRAGGRAERRRAPQRRCGEAACMQGITSIDGSRAPENTVAGFRLTDQSCSSQMLSHCCMHACTRKTCRRRHEACAPTCGWRSPRQPACLPACCYLPACLPGWVT